jgi:hypothetical protein
MVSRTTASSCAAETLIEEGLTVCGRGPVGRHRIETLVARVGRGHDSIREIEFVLRPSLGRVNVHERVDSLVVGMRTMEV